MHGKVLQCALGHNEFGSYCVPLSSKHRPAAAAILASDIWEPDTIRFIVENVGQGDIIHAGAYFGDFIPALSAGLQENCQLWAFEPNQENYRCAQITSLLNDCQNVALFNAALARNSGRAKLAISDDRGIPLGGGSHISNSKATVEVETMMIDDVIPSSRNVSILQLDVEHYEQYALAGGLRLVGRCLPIIILETLPNMQWLEAHLQPLGYEARAKVHANTILAVSEI